MVADCGLVSQEQQTNSSNISNVSIIVFGDLNKYDIVNQETVNNCRWVLEAFIAKAKPVSRFSDGKISLQTRGCSVTVLAVSRNRNILRRKETTKKVKEHLINCYWLPKDCIVELPGRNFKDICTVLKERKFSGDVIVAGTKVSFWGRDRLAATLMSDGFGSPKYLDYP